MCLVVLYLLVSFSSFAQENKEPKKASGKKYSTHRPKGETGDEYIGIDIIKTSVASEPVPGAEITVEQVPGPTIIKSIGKTGNNGEFTINVTQEQFKKLPEEFQLKFRIKPKEKDKYPVENNSFILKVKKSDGPKFKFVVVYLPSTPKPNKPSTPELKGNKGCFAVNAKAQN